MILKIISNLTFLHSIYSFLVNIFPNFLIHNTSKYIAIKKYYSIFGLTKLRRLYRIWIFTGSSFKHTIKTENRVNKKTKQDFLD